MDSSPGPRASQQPYLVQWLFNLVDPIGLGRSFSRALLEVAARPAASAPATARYFGDLVRSSLATAGRLAGAGSEGPVRPTEHDTRFSDETWSQNAFFYWLLQVYLLKSRLLTELVDAAGLPEPEGAKARFMAGVLVDSFSPTNFFFTNPKAIKRAFDTGGRSVALGWRNFFKDLYTNGGWPSQVRKDLFHVGENLAVTTGRVVFRNELIELIQYEPQTPEVYSVPILFCPPWINKYYIMDLSPGKSLVEWALKHGLAVFAISYRNPDSSMRDLSFEDYLMKGPLAAIGVVRSITRAPKVNTLSVCLGGTLNAVLVAYLEATGKGDLVNSSTYLNALIDYGHAGVLKDVFTDEGAVDAVVQRMGARGYLAASDMAHTFDMLRPNDLIFRYVTSNWLLGEDPPAFDLLAWNNDSTRMPAKMHAFYLRTCWAENALAEDRLELGGRRLLVSENTDDSYFVAAVNDHIVPWRSNYLATQLFRGERRFVLTSGGHVAGIVNPPSPRARLWTGTSLPPDPDEWLAGATETAGTWWDDWVNWVVPRSGKLRAPYPLGNSRYPAGEAAPGEYVRG